MQAERRENNPLTNLLWYLIIVLLSGALVLRLIINGDTGGLAVNSFISLLILSGFLLWVIHQLTLISSPPFRFGLLSVSWGLLLLLVLLSPLVASYQFGALGYAITWGTDLLLFYLILQLGHKEPYLLHLWLQALLVTGLIIILYALTQYFYGLEELRAAVRGHPAYLSSIPPELREEFQARLQANQPFATFIYQNSLGGFITLIFPLALGWLTQLQIIPQGGSAGKISWLRIFSYIIFLGLMLFVLWTTGAVGAWIALLVALIVYLILWKWTSLTQGLRRIITWGTLILILTGLIMLWLVITSRTVPDWFKGISPSLETRWGYWQGAGKIIQDHFWTGVGLNNFADYYLQAKTAAAGETTRVHNDFLQVWSELGIFGLLSFVGLWVMILVRAVRSVTITTSHQVPASLMLTREYHHAGLSWCVILGGALAFLVGEVVQAPFRLSENLPGLFPLIGFAIWAGFFMWQTRHLARLIPTRYLSYGLIAGLSGLLVHSLVDFDFYVPGLVQTVWFMAGCLVALTVEEPAGPAVSRIPRFRTMKILLSTSLVLILVLVSFWFLPKLSASEDYLERGKTHLSRGDDLLAGLREIKQATEINPYRAETWHELAQAAHYALCLNLASNQSSATVSHEVLPPCIIPINRAIALSPRSAGLYFTKAIFYAEHSQWYQHWARRVSEPTSQESLLRLSQVSLQQARDALEQARQYYPTRPEYLYHLGRVYEQMHQPEKAADWYRQALDLNQKVIPQRLKLSPETVQQMIQYLQTE